MCLVGPEKAFAYSALTDFAMYFRSHNETRIAELLYDCVWELYTKQTETHKVTDQKICQIEVLN